MHITIKVNNVFGNKVTGSIDNGQGMTKPCVFEYMLANDGSVVIGDVTVYLRDGMQALVWPSAIKNYKELQQIIGE
jgi:hypothetical protein